LIGVNSGGIQKKVIQLNRSYRYYLTELKRPSVGAVFWFLMSGLSIDDFVEQF